VDRLADRDVPPVDELELGHGVGVAGRHVVGSFVVVERRAAGVIFGGVVVVVRRVAMVDVQDGRRCGWVMRRMLDAELHWRLRTSSDMSILITRLRRQR